MSLEKSILIDSLVFFIVNFYIIIWVMKKRIAIKEKLSYILLFIVFNSSYNIMIKPIHDYNIVIPRTFIWRYKVLGSFSLMDIIFIIFFIFFIFKNINLFAKNKLIRLVYIRVLIYVVIGSAMFFLNRGYWLDNGANYIINMKGVIYFCSTVVLVYKYIRRSISDVNYIKIFCLILLSGMISTFFIDNNYLWVRYGNAIKIIDQEDAYGISLIVIFYLFFHLKENKSFKNYTILIIMLLQNLICVYKANFVNLIIAIFVGYVLFYKKSRQNFTKLYVVELIILSGLLVKINKIKEILFSKAILTRINQAVDFLNQMYSNGIGSILFGLGIGTPYQSSFNLNDGGELKAIDMDILQNGYRNTVQIPVIGSIKSIGFLGWGLIMLISLKVLLYLKNIILKFKQDFSIEFKALTLMLVIFLFTSTTEIAVTGTSPTAIIAAFILSRLALEIESKNSAQHD